MKSKVGLLTAMACIALCGGAMLSWSIVGAEPAAPQDPSPDGIPAPSQDPATSSGELTGTEVDDSATGDFDDELDGVPQPSALTQDVIAAQRAFAAGVPAREGENPFLECPPGSLSYSQLPSQRVFGFFSDDSSGDITDQRMSDNFVVATGGNLTGMTIFGIYTDLAAGQGQFEIAEPGRTDTCYQDGAPGPGNGVCQGPAFPTVGGAPGTDSVGDSCTDDDDCPRFYPDGTRATNGVCATFSMIQKLMETCTVDEDCRIATACAPESVRIDCCEGRRCEIDDDCASDSTCNLTLDPNGQPVGICNGNLCQDDDDCAATNSLCDLSVVGPEGTPGFGVCTDADFVECSTCDGAFCDDGKEVTEIAGRPRHCDTELGLCTPDSDQFTLVYWDAFPRQFGFRRDGTPFPFGTTTGLRGTKALAVFSAARGGFCVDSSQCNQGRPCLPEGICEGGLQLVEKVITGEQNFRPVPETMIRFTVEHPSFAVPDNKCLTFEFFANSEGRELDQQVGRRINSSNLVELIQTANNATPRVCPDSQVTCVERLGTNLDRYAGQCYFTITLSEEGDKNMEVFTNMCGVGDNSFDCSGDPSACKPGFGLSPTPLSNCGISPVPAPPDDFGECGFNATGLLGDNNDCDNVSFCVQGSGGITLSSTAECRIAVDLVPDSVCANCGPSNIAGQACTTNAQCGAGGICAGGFCEDACVVGAQQAMSGVFLGFQPQGNQGISAGPRLRFGDDPVEGTGGNPSGGTSGDDVIQNSLHSLVTAGGPVRTADNFHPIVDGPITSVCWWGYNFWNTANDSGRKNGFNGFNGAAFYAGGCDAVTCTENTCAVDTDCPCGGNLCETDADCDVGITCLTGVGLCDDDSFICATCGVPTPCTTDADCFDGRFCDSDGDCGLDQFLNAITCDLTLLEGEGRGLCLDANLTAGANACDGGFCDDPDVGLCDPPKRLQCQVDPDGDFGPQIVGEIFEISYYVDDAVGRPGPIASVTTGIGAGACAVDSDCDRPGHVGTCDPARDGGNGECLAIFNVLADFTLTGLAIRLGRPQKEWSAELPFGFEVFSNRGYWIAITNRELSGRPCTTDADCFSRGTCDTDFNLCNDQELGCFEIHQLAPTRNDPGETTALGFPIGNGDGVAFERRLSFENNPNGQTNCPFEGCINVTNDHEWSNAELRFWDMSWAMNIETDRAFGPTELAPGGNCIAATEAEGMKDITADLGNATKGAPLILSTESPYTKKWVPIDPGDPNGDVINSAQALDFSTAACEDSGFGTNFSDFVERQVLAFRFIATEEAIAVSSCGSSIDPQNSNSLDTVVTIMQRSDTGQGLCVPNNSLGLACSDDTCDFLPGDGEFCTEKLIIGAEYFIVLSVKSGAYLTAEVSAYPIEVVSGGECLLDTEYMPTEGACCTKNATCIDDVTQDECENLPTDPDTAGFDGFWRGPRPCSEVADTCFFVAGENSCTAATAPGRVFGSNFEAIIDLTQTPRLKDDDCVNRPGLPGWNEMGCISLCRGRPNQDYSFNSSMRAGADGHTTGSWFAFTATHTSAIISTNNTPVTSCGNCTSGNDNTPTLIPEIILQQWEGECGELYPLGCDRNKGENADVDGNPPNETPTGAMRARALQVGRTYLVTVEARNDFDRAVVSLLVRSPTFDDDVGSCCVSDGTCQNLTKDNCDAVGGRHGGGFTPRGAGSLCDGRVGNMCIEDKDCQTEAEPNAGCLTEGNNCANDADCGGAEGSCNAAGFCNDTAFIGICDDSSFSTRAPVSCGGGACCFDDPTGQILQGRDQFVGPGGLGRPSSLMGLCESGLLGDVTQAECEGGETFGIEGTCPEAASWVFDGDANGDGAVDAADTGFIQARFGSSTAGPDCQADVNCDGAIDAADTGYVQARFGSASAPAVSACIGELIPGRFAGMGTTCEYSDFANNFFNSPSDPCGYLPGDVCVDAIELTEGIIRPGMTEAHKLAVAQPDPPWRYVMDSRMYHSDGPTSWCDLWFGSGGRDGQWGGFPAGYDIYFKFTAPKSGLATVVIDGFGVNASCLASGNCCEDPSVGVNGNDDGAFNGDPPVGWFTEDGKCLFNEAGDNAEFIDYWAGGPPTGNARFGVSHDAHAVVWRLPEDLGDAQDNCDSLVRIPNDGIFEGCLLRDGGSNFPDDDDTRQGSFRVTEGETIYIQYSDMGKLDNFNSGDLGQVRGGPFAIFIDIQSCVDDSDCVDDTNPCTVGVCITEGPEQGLCVQNPAPDRTVCNDANPCTTLDACLNGLCTGRVIDGLDDGDDCTADVCNTACLAETCQGGSEIPDSPGFIPCDLRECAGNTCTEPLDCACTGTFCVTDEDLTPGICSAGSSENDGLACGGPGNGDADCGDGTCEGQVLVCGGEECILSQGLCDDGELKCLDCIGGVGPGGASLCNDGALECDSALAGCPVLVSGNTACETSADCVGFNQAIGCIVDQDTPTVCSLESDPIDVGKDCFGNEDCANGRCVQIGVCTTRITARSSCILDDPGTGAGHCTEVCEPFECQNGQLPNGEPCVLHIPVNHVTAPGGVFACANCGSNEDCAQDDNVCTENVCGARPLFSEPLGVPDSGSTKVCEIDEDCGDVGGLCDPDLGRCIGTVINGTCIERNSELGTGCDDGTFCTQNDVCVDGGCIGEPIVCDDLDSCTSDVCNPCGQCEDNFDCCTGTPCEFDVECPGSVCDTDTGLCADTQECTVACDGLGWCDDGACIRSGTGDPADFAFPCGAPDRTDVEPFCRGCNPELPGTTCDDLINTMQRCSLDSSVNAGVPCILNNPDCGDGTCVNPACIVTVACNDDGTCEYGGKCDDGNVCTDDDCDINGVCLNFPVGGGCCSENTPCGDTGEACTEEVCNAANTCDVVAVEGCCNLDEDCPDDGNACTDEVCQGNVCVAVNNDANACDDGNPCTDDTCSAGVCGGANDDNNLCDDGNSCTDDACVAGDCVGTGNVANACDDGNGCTDDACNAAGDCVATDNSAACDDGNPCTDDVCTAGACAGTGNAANSCTDGNECTDDTCDNLGACNSVNNTIVCNDGDPCTTVDICADGACGGDPTCPEDASFCNGAAACDAGACSETGDPCAGAEAGFSCDEDADACTCGGGSVCSAGSAVNPGGACLVDKDCDGGTVGQGDCIGGETDCNDDDACTLDVCGGPGVGCEHLPIPGCTPCDRGAITQGDCGCNVPFEECERVAGLSNRDVGTCQPRVFDRCIAKLVSIEGADCDACTLVLTDQFYAEACPISAFGDRDPRQCVIPEPRLCPGTSACTLTFDHQFRDCNDNNDCDLFPPNSSRFIQGTCDIDGVACTSETEVLDCGTGFVCDQDGTCNFDRCISVPLCADLTDSNGRSRPNELALPPTGLAAEPFCCDVGGQFPAQNTGRCGDTTLEDCVCQVSEACCTLFWGASCIGIGQNVCGLACPGN